MADSDLLSIRRKRRQEKRCLACGIPTPRAALCVSCRATLRYCPRCEAIYPACEASQRDSSNGRATAYCVPCGNAVRNHRGRSRAEYLAEQRGRSHPHLKQIVRLYREGRTYNEIADALAINRGTLRGLVGRARKTGRWPAQLARLRRKRHDHRATTAVAQPAAAHATRSGSGAS